MSSKQRARRTPSSKTTKQNTDRRNNARSSKPQGAIRPVSLSTFLTGAVPLLLIAYYLFDYWQSSTMVVVEDSPTPLRLEPPRYKISPEVLLAANESATPFVVMKIPGRGMGAVAIRDIKQGELILRENPLFTLPLKIDGDPEELVLAALSNLSSNARSQFINLSHHSHSKSGSNTEDELGIDGPTALSILQTNAISASPGNLGIFPQIARLNHGCGGAFNAVYNFRPPIAKPEAETSTDEEQEPEDFGFMVLHALKPIPANTELLTTYFTSRLPRSQRRDYLLQHYHFACDCALCSLPEAEIKESDARMEEVDELRKRLGLWATEGEGGIEGDDAIRVINKYWAVSEAEAYWSERGQMASDAAHVAAAHSDRLATTAWAGLASIWYGYELGADSDPAQAMGYFAYNPEGHFAWGTRKELVVGSPSPWILAGL